MAGILVDIIPVDCCAVRKISVNQTRRAGAYRGRPGIVWSTPSTGDGQGSTLGSGSTPDAAALDKFHVIFSLLDTWLRLGVFFQVFFMI